MLVVKTMFLQVFLGLSAFAQYNTNPDCKCTPTEKCWPIQSEWSKLNESVSGNLIRYTPPGAVCYKGSSYNAQVCNATFQAYTSPAFMLQDPGTIMMASWTNNSCLPTLNPDGKCEPTGWPEFVINASTPEYAQAGIKFAKKHNIRINVKGTGHDFKGKSTAAYSLSIWTHYMKNLVFHDDYKSCKEKSYSAVTIAAGNTWGDVFPKAEEKGVLVVGGSVASVGIGGFILAGGHGPVTAQYGLASQQAIEFEVVTPDGLLVIANECKNSDLFWALCGGGGSTFGVMTSVTVKTYPNPKVSIAFVYANYTGGNNKDAYWDSIGLFHEMLPIMVESGVQGYYFVVNEAVYTGFYAMFLVVDKPSSVLVEQLNPYIKELNESERFKGNFKTSPVVPIEFPTFFTAWNATIGGGGTATASDAGKGPTTGGYALASRLLPKRAFTKNSREFLASKLRASTPPEGGKLLGHMIAGPLIANNTGPGSIVNPSWRDCYSHLISVVPFGDNQTSVDMAFDFALNTGEYNLRSLAPKAGAYINEALPNENNWQQSFYGDNYPRLYSIKEKYDPTGVFYCVGCPGSEKWYTDASGLLCKVEWVK